MIHVTTTNSRSEIKKKIDRKVVGRGRGGGEKMQMNLMNPLFILFDAKLKHVYNCNFIRSTDERK